ncbi:MAG: thioredoxin family protein [Opitutales bacterium]
MKKHLYWTLPLIAAFAAVLFANAETKPADSVKLNWMTDYDAAVARAQSEDKVLLLDFTGSDWCGWCIKLDKEVFSRAEFAEYAKENLVLVKLDFPRGKPQSAEVKEQNERLAGKYGIRGFPTILLLSEDEELIGRTGYRPGGASKYVAHLKDLIG